MRSSRISTETSSRLVSGRCRTLARLLLVTNQASSSPDWDSNSKLCRHGHWALRLHWERDTSRQQHCCGHIREQRPATEVAAHLSVRWHEWEAAALPASWKRVERPLQLQNGLLPRVEECVGFVWEQSVWLTDSAEHKSGAVSLPIKSTLLSDMRSWSLKTNTSRYRCKVVPHAFKSQRSCCSRAQ